MATLSRKERILLVIALATALFGSQLACLEDEYEESMEEVREVISTVGCTDPDARDACGEDMTCQIKACD